MVKSFAWKQRKTHTFGAVFDMHAFPFLQTSDGIDWIEFEFEIDSGAFITAMNAGDCDLLGYDLERGVVMELEPIGSPKIKFFIHYVNMRIGDHELNNVPVAFAERDRPIKRLLLGRLAVFHSLNVHFQPGMQQTIFSP